MQVDEATRRHLVFLARRRSARRTEFSRGRPTEWRPEQVRNPNGLLYPYFSDDEAWELIASRIEEGHPLETVRLDRPAGKTGYVMKIDVEQGQPQIYIKLELGSGEIFGRSFHYSERRG